MSKRRRKMRWIENKFYKKEEVPDTINGVTVKDQELDDSFKIKVITYGGVDLTEDEISVMEMHPKYTVFEKVDPIDCEAEIEKAMAKVRWARMEEKRNENRQTNRVGDRNRSTQEQDAQVKETFNIDEGKFDFRYARSTELPFNIRTNVPGPLEDREEEIRLQNLKTELKEVTDKYAEERRTEMKNLTEKQKRGIKSLKRKQ